MRLVKLAALAAVMSLPVAAQAGDADLSLVPKDTAMVLHVNMARFRNSTFFKTVVSGMLNAPAIKMQVAAAKTEMGFDPTTDLDSITIIAPTNMGQPGAEPLVMLQGKSLDQKAIAAKINKGSITVASAKGRLLLGENKAVTAAQKGGGAAGLNALLGKTNQKADLWFVANLPPALQQQMAAGNPMAKGMKSMRGSIDFAAGLKLDMAVNTPMAKQAAAEGTKAMQQALKEPMITQMGLAPMLQKLQIKANGNDLTVGVALNDAEVGKLQMMAQMMMMMAGGGAKAPPMAPAPKAAPAPTKTGK